MSTISSKRSNLRRVSKNGRVPNFRTVWASLQETDRQMKESAEKYEREKKERDEKYEREKRESAEKYEREKKERAEQDEREKKEKAEQYEREKKERAEQDEREKKEKAERYEREKKENEERYRKMDESYERVNKQIGKLGGRFGEMIEYMVLPNLVRKFRDLGFEFTKAYPEANIEDHENKIFAEIDITLENGDKVMIVEVKSKPKTEDITEHVERMGKVRRHGDLHGDKRKFLGAIAGMVFTDDVKTFAMKKGFYVIVPSGETFIITVPEGEYSPKEW